MSESGFEIPTDVSTDVEVSVLHRVKTTIPRGWPETKRDVRPKERPYFTLRDKLMVANNTSTKDNDLSSPPN